MTGQTQPYTRSEGLPFFERPPVTQVDVGVQLQALRFHAVDLGKLYSHYEKFYPIVEEFPPTPMAVEQFQANPPSGVQFQFKLLDRPPLPMLIFQAADRSSLVQVDSNRLFTSWRRSNPEVSYPRYENIRSNFIRDINTLNLFASEISAKLKITQAEISYINDIPIERDPEPDILAKSFSPGAYGDEISAVGVTRHLTYRTEQGVDYARLHISAEPVFTQPDKSLRISLVYRGEPRERFPDEDSLSATIRFVDEGHDRIVQAFAENTRVEAHRKWGEVT